jgi:hypothetical protein
VENLPDWKVLYNKGLIDFANAVQPTQFMPKCTIWSYSLDQFLELPQLLSTGAGVALGLDLRHDIRTRSIREK